MEILLKISHSRIGCFKVHVLSFYNKNNKYNMASKLHTDKKTDYKIRPLQSTYLTQKLDKSKHNLYLFNRSLDMYIDILRTVDGEYAPLILYM